MTDVITPDYKTKGITLIEDPQLEAISLVDIGANKKRFFLLKRAANFVDASGDLITHEEGDEEIAKVSPLLKGGDPEGDEWKVAYTVVAEPWEVDQQKDVWTPGQIRKAAHDFLKRGPLVNFMHKDLQKVGEVVESYIVKEDNGTHINGTHIPQGSWVIGIEPHPQMKEMIQKGEVTGVSVQGTSARKDVPKSTTVFRRDGRQYIEELLEKHSADCGCGMHKEGLTAQSHGPEKPGGFTHMPNGSMVVNIEDRIIPLGAEGPGILKLQQILGVPETGSFDEHTQTAFLEKLEAMGRPRRATVANIKAVIAEYETRMAMEQAAAQGPAPTPAVQLPGTQEVEKDYGVDRAYDPSYNDSALTNYYRGGRADGFGQTVIGVKPGDEGIQPPMANLGPDSSVDDMKAVLIQSSVQGNEMLNAYMRDNLSITDPYQLLYFEIDPKVLWGMISAFVFGNDPSLSFAPITGRSVVVTQPTFTPPELFPTGSGFSVQKRAYRNLDQDLETQQVFGNLKTHLEELEKAGMLDFRTPLAFTYDKNGLMLSEGVVVKAGGQTGEVSSINTTTNEVNVMWRDKNGEEVVKTFDAKKLSAIPAALPMLMKRGEVTDSQGFAIEKGAIVRRDSDDQVGEVVEVNENDGTIILETINKDIELVKEAMPAASVTVINSVKSKKADKEEAPPKELNLAKAAGPASGRAGGSVGGSDPRKFGKIRFIVQSFGKWAGGKHRICVARLRAEHPEIANGREPALCAWLKDQYLNTTAWRRGSQVLKAAGSLIEGHELSDAEVDFLYKIACEDMGIPHEEPLQKMEAGDEAYDLYMDGLFNVPETSPELVAKVMKIVSGGDSLKKRASDLVTLLSDLEDEDSKSKISSAVTELSKSVEEIYSLDELGSGAKAALVKESVSDFAELVTTYIEKSEKENPVNKYWEEDEYIYVDGYEPLVKGWLPEGTSKGDLDDGDFAWLSDDYKDGKASKSEGRKLPYKIHGKVNVRGWKAAWAALHGARGGTDFSGGPSKEQVEDKLLRDKPKDVEVEKMNKLATNGAVMPDNRNRRKLNHNEVKTDMEMNKAVPVGGVAEMDAVAAVPAAPGMGDEVGGDKDMVGKSVKGPDGNRYIVIDQDGDMLTVAAGRKRAQFSVDEVEVVEDGDDVDAELGGMPEGEAPVEVEKDATEVAEAPVAEGEAVVDDAPVAEAEAGVEDEIRRAIETLNAVLAGVGTKKPEPQMVEKAGEEVAEAAPTATSLNDVIYFVNDLADQLDELRNLSGGVSEIGAKVDKVGELVKSVDISGTISAFEERLQAIENRLSSLNETTETAVTEVSKRVSQMETKPGRSTQAVQPSNTRLEKSGTGSVWSGMF